MLAETDPSPASLLARIRQLVPSIQAHAQTLDAQSGFPESDLAALRQAGALRAVLPEHLGGMGLGTEAYQAPNTASLLHLLGYGSIALGRVFEAHMNAIRLVCRYGDAAHHSQVAEDCAAGHLHALWVTDGPSPLRYHHINGGITLEGGKRPCSAAGFADRAVVTATSPAGDTRLLLLQLGQGETASALSSSLQGVRGAVTGRVDFSGTRHPENAVFGAPGDYLRQPDFSAGAWRTSAITVGALCALVEAVRAELQIRDRLGHPQQRERFGRLLIHAQSASLWLAHMAPIAENAENDAAQVVATVNLARIAIEAACLESITLTQKSLGMSALMQSNPVERMCRDLATYLRQPAADEALDEAAAYFGTQTHLLGQP